MSAPQVFTIGSPRSSCAKVRYDNQWFRATSLSPCKSLPESSVICLHVVFIVDVLQVQSIEVRESNGEKHPDNKYERIIVVIWPIPHIEDTHRPVEEPEEEESSKEDVPHRYVLKPFFCSNQREQDTDHDRSGQKEQT